MANKLHNGVQNFLNNVHIVKRLNMSPEHTHTHTKMQLRSSLSVPCSPAMIATDLSKRNLAICNKSVCCNSYLSCDTD